MAMNKTQQWNKIQEIASEHKFSDEAMKALAELLEPKKKGGGAHSDRIIKNIDGKTYKSCRYTNRLWAVDDLIYQNDEMREKDKDKGYSKIGIALWTKGQKKLKDLKNEMFELAMADEVNQKKLGEVKKEVLAIQDGNLTNNSEWLMGLATPEQAKLIEESSIEI